MAEGASSASGWVRRDLPEVWPPRCMPVSGRWDPGAPVQGCLPALCSAEGMVSCPLSVMEVVWVPSALPVVSALVVLGSPVAGPIGE